MGGALKNRLKTIYKRIENAKSACGRSMEDVTLVAVSKRVSVENIKEAILAGAYIFGENYIQEARDKIRQISECSDIPSVSWHFIGHLQTNKAKYAVKLFDLIHTVDSLKLAQEVDRQARKKNKVQHILIQVNIAEEASKNGIRPDEIMPLLKQIYRFENISVRGLMTIPPYFNSPERVRPFFKSLKVLRDQIIAANIPNITMEALSMGMTGDFETAIAEGATFVRVGTAIFGERR